MPTVYEITRDELNDALEAARQGDGRQDYLIHTLIFNALSKAKRNDILKTPNVVVEVLPYEAKDGKQRFTVYDRVWDQQVKTAITFLEAVKAVKAIEKGAEKKTRAREDFSPATPSRTRRINRPHSSTTIS